MKTKKRYLKRLSKKIALSLLLGSVTALTFVPSVYALPQVGSYTNAATIETDASGVQMDISSNATNNVLNWQGFSIGSDETVNFNGSNKSYLNLVNGVTKSKIYGTLNGGTNTNIYLVNPNGIIFGKTASVNVSNLVASTRAIDSVNTNDFIDNGTNPITTTNVSSAIGDITNLGDVEAQSIVLEGRNIIIQDAARVTTDGTTKLKDVTIKASGDATVGHKVDTKTTLTLNVDENGDGVYTSENHEVSDYASAKVMDFVVEGDTAYVYGSGDLTATKDGKYASGYTLQDLGGTTRSEDDSTLKVREGIIDAMLVEDIYDLQNINNSGGNTDGSFTPLGDYLLADDIDASATANWQGNFTPLGGNPDTNGNIISGFNGSFNGADNTITGLVVKAESKTVTDTSGTASQSQINAGLFGYATNSTIKNVRLEDCDITGIGNGNIGTLVGKLERGTIENVYSTGSVTGEVSGSQQKIIVGGIAGYLDGADLSNSYNETTINVSDSHVKGSDTNFNCFSAGGIAGELWNSATVKDVYNTGTITGSTSDTNIFSSFYYKLAGIVGFSFGGSIENTYNSASITGEGDCFTIGGVEVPDLDLSGPGIITANNYYATTDASGNAINQNVYDKQFGYATGSITGLTYDEMLDSSKYTFVDADGISSIDTIGGKHKTWRTYEGKTMPLLTYFLETVAIKDSSTIYSGLEQTATIESALEGEELDPSKLIDIKGTDAGSYLIYSGQHGYDFVSEDENSSPVFTIDQKELTVTMNDSSMTYGNANALLIEDSGDISNDSLDKGYYYISGFVNNEASDESALALDEGDTKLSIEPSYTNNAIYKDADGAYKTKEAGTYSGNAGLEVTGTIENLKNYKISETGNTSGTLTINRVDLTLQANYNGSVTYGDKDNTLSEVTKYSYTTTGTGFVNGDDGDSLTSGKITYANTAFDAGTKDTINAGESYHASINKTVALTNALSNYNVTVTNSEDKTVLKKAITLTANEASRTYDGLTGLSAGQVLSGTDTSVLVNGDETNASISYDLNDSSAKNVRRYDVKGTITGVDNLRTNYDISDITNDAYTINKAELELKANDVSSVYGSSESDITYGYTTTEGKGFVNGDDGDTIIKATGLELNYANSGYKDSTHTNDVGDNYIVTIGLGYSTHDVKSRMVAAEPSLENYNVSFVDGNSSITKASLELAANYSPDSITYGDPDSLGNYSCSVGGLVNGDTVSSLGLGEKLLYTNEGYKDDGHTQNVADDYEFSVSTASQNTINNDLTNYDITYKSDTFNIEPKTLRLFTDNANLVYGGTIDDIQWGYTDESYGKDTHYMIFSFTNGETSIEEALANDPNKEAKVDIEYDFSKAFYEDGTTRDARNVGYSITYKNSSTLTNYIVPEWTSELGQGLGSIYIHKADLELKANDVSSVYGSPESDITYGYTTTDGKGFVNGDDGDTLINETGGISYCNSGYKDNGYTKDVSDDYTVSMDVSTPMVVSYASIPIASSPFSNYNIKLVDGKSAITPKAITLTANEAERTYDGLTGLSEGQVLTGTDTSVLVNGDETNASISYALSDSSAKNAGSYDVKGTITGVDNLSTNYNVTDLTEGAYTINPKELTVTMNDSSMTYGNVHDLLIEDSGDISNDSLDKGYYYVSGFVNNEASDESALALDEGETKLSITPSYINNAIYKDASGAYKTKDAGTYSGNVGLEVTGASENLKNYKISETGNTSGTLTINQADLSITPNDVVVAYGDLASTEGYTSKVVGLTNGDTKSDLIDGKLEYSNSAFEDGKTKEVGTDYIVSIANIDELNSDFDFRNYKIDYGTSFGTIQYSSYNRIDDVVDGKDAEYNKIIDLLMAPEPNEIHNRRVVKSNVVSQNFFEVQVDTTRTVEKIITTDGRVYSMDTYAGLLEKQK